jgi:ribosomal protein S18 acetylase RimI-like enzyme
MPDRERISGRFAARSHGEERSPCNNVGVTRHVDEMLFEPFIELHDSDRLPALDDLLIRPASMSDVTEVSEVEAAREGGDAADRASTIASAITSCSTSRQGLNLVAQHENRLVGFARARYFDPPADAPQNVAPRGWYLSGVIVVPGFRRRGVGGNLTRARLDWIGQRDDWAYYFANAQNRVSIRLHERFGFAEVTRDFSVPGVSFEGGNRILLRLRVRPPT